MTSVPRYFLRPLGALLAAGLLAAGCGGDSGDDEAEAGGKESGEPSEDTTEAAFPVDVDHKYGTTTIPAEPERVVTLGLSDHDPVLALGVVPVGVDDWFGERPFGIWPWEDGLWGDVEPEIVGERDEYNIEKIASLTPDLIIAMYSGMTEAQYDTLSEIAPVVAQPVGFDDYAAPWQDMTLHAGRALGQEEKAQELVDGIDEQLAAVRDEHPEFEGQTVAVVDPYQPGLYAVFAGYDPKVALLVEMGYVVPDEIVEAAGDDYAAEISSERLDLIDVDRLLFLTGPEGASQAEIEADSVFASLDVAKEDRAVYVPYDEPPIGGALSFSTVLSIPYAIEQLVPLLAE